ncbi:hypothetical protein GGE16_005454 [Rhizobium leguminosarum]|uniref:Uncharacterized protein n=1 Tax=Rhizobium leguminosarum TaxID=384 RepID=A0AAE2SYT4_RHILE|nr:hypothetical protein [Rhizobium leguminosarum]MBB4435585.1 hypothetical protein [Rhizobium esperanzae]MBB4296022.1 hypothetical protein [Rhizobium leguminosarum]MBB4311371.1 hypothetical protein [Rhizobium leguminosarum]MBB4420247.1 hypothetical protein [Rhizobium leguminosarum]
MRCVIPAAAPCSSRNGARRRTCRSRTNTAARNCQQLGLLSVPIHYSAARLRTRKGRCSSWVPRIVPMR